MPKSEVSASESARMLMLFSARILVPRQGARPYFREKRKSVPHGPWRSSFLTRKYKIKTSGNLNPPIVDHRWALPSLRCCRSWVPPFHTGRDSQKLLYILGRFFFRYPADPDLVRKKDSPTSTITVRVSRLSRRSTRADSGARPP